MLFSTLRTTSLVWVLVHALILPEAKLSRNTSFSFGSAVGNGLGDGIGVGVGVGVGAAVGVGVELEDEDELEEELDDLAGLFVASGVGVGSSEGGEVAVASGCCVGEGSTFWYIDKKPEFKTITVTAAATKRTMTPVSAKSLFLCIIILPKTRLEV